MAKQTENHKIILITGATSGIGKAAAIALAKQGNQIIIHGRDLEKTEKVRKEIIQICEHDNIDILVADLYSLEEVRKMAAKFNQKYAQLDVLINNAGSLMGNKREISMEGNEKTIALNLLTPFLLTALLFDKLRKSKSARIINVSSSAHKQNAKPDFKDPQNATSYAPLKVYGNAKLFLILISQCLDKKLKMNEIDNLTVNTLHPGAVASNFSVESDLGIFINYIGKLARLFFKTSEQGADTIVYLASSSEIEGVSGKYFIDRKPAKVGVKYNTPENENLIWKYCEQVTRLKFLQF